MPKKKQKITIKLIYITVSLVIIIFIFIKLLNFFKASNYFQIKEVVYFGIDNPLEIDEYIELRGKNLFEIDLDKVKRHILQRYPEIRKAKIQRVFPNKIRIDIEARKPIARIKYRADYLFIDDEGRAIQKARFVSKQDLPIIVGLNLDFRNQKSHSSKELSLALALLKTIKEFRGLEGYTISKVDVSDIKDTSFFINYDIQIKIGDTDFRDRLKILSMLLGRFKTQIQEIKYIDLRFKDPIIAKK